MNGRQHFSTLLVPHRPVRFAKSIADTIATLVDTPDTSVVKITAGPATEWIGVNPTGAGIDAGGLVTDARVVYVRRLGDRFTHVLARDATTLMIDGQALHRAPKRATIDK